MRVFMKKVIQFLRRRISTLLMYLFRVFPVDRKKVVFCSYFGRSISGNPWCIFQSMRKKMPNYHYIWLSTASRQQNVPGATVVDLGSIKAIYHLATAACWVDNCRKRTWVRKRNSQYYVQTWHGNVALKKVEADVTDKLPKLYVKAARRDSKMADIFVSGSKWLSGSYRRSYWYDGAILESGLPRADAFYQDPATIRARVDDWFKGDGTVRYVLYAPTFRVDESLDAYIHDYDRILEAVKARFGGKWKCLVRLHPIIASKKGSMQFSNEVLDASDYPDINDLIIRSEILISDYSSCVFDASEAGKVVIIYATDIEEYERDRGFEWSFDELPFPLCTDMEQLCKTLIGIDIESYRIKAKGFMEQCGILNGPDSSNKVADHIIGQIQGICQKP